jgi:hypothetical protein
VTLTAISELRVALATILADDPGLDALLSGRKVYLFQAPVGVALNYVVVGQPIVDTTDPYYGQGARRHRRRLTAWARTAWTAEDIYARMVVILDGVLLSLDGGHTMQRSSLSYLAGPIEDEDRKAWGVTADWLVKTREG